MTAISTSPEIGGRSGVLMVIRAWFGRDCPMRSSMSVSSKKLPRSVGGGVGRCTFTGMLRGWMEPEAKRL